MLQCSKEMEIEMDKEAISLAIGLGQLFQKLNPTQRSMCNGLLRISPQEVVGKAESRSEDLGFGERSSYNLNSRGTLEIELHQTYLLPRLKSVRLFKLPQ